jgi:two-component system phosphate regulon sensor histidine kinase PhoR
LGLIREENKRLGVLVENVLRASLSESGAMRLYTQPLNVHDLVKGVVKNMAMQFHKKGAKVELDLGASNPNLECDRIHLTNVMFNLIDNAMKYAGDDPCIVIRTRQSDFGLSLSVQDNGMGIAKEHLGKVFERLYRVPTGNVHNVKGFGLGLSYVKNVIERHEGSVQIESTPGEGTTLTLNLPFEHQPDKTEET